MSWAVIRYIELNPVRAGMVEHPGEYRWSSYRANAQGEACSALNPHESYRALGTDEHARQTAYRELFRYQLDPRLVDEIREGTNGNYAAVPGSRNRRPRCWGAVWCADGPVDLRKRLIPPRVIALELIDDKPWSVPYCAASSRRRARHGDSDGAKATLGEIGGLRQARKAVPGGESGIPRRRLLRSGGESVRYDAVSGIRRVHLEGVRSVALDEQQAVPPLERSEHVRYTHVVRPRDGGDDLIKLRDNLRRSRNLRRDLGNVILVADDDQCVG
jgi:hypothetical protein